MITTAILKALGVAAVTLLLATPTLHAQECLLSVEFPNGTTNLSGEVVDATTGYKLTYYEMHYLEDKNDKSYYQFHSKYPSYVQIETPPGEYFQPGDEVRLDTYVNRSSSDYRTISLYDRVNYSGTTSVATASAQGGVITVYTLTLPADLPASTNLLYIPATSSINSYISIHGVEVYGERGLKAKLAALTLGGTAQLEGYGVSYQVDATSDVTSVSLVYEKEEGKDVTLALSQRQEQLVENPADLTVWDDDIPTSLPIPAIPGRVDYYYLRSSLADHETIYYELRVARRNTADVVYIYDFTVNPVTSAEDPALTQIVHSAGYHSGHGWRFNYNSGNNLRVKVEGDAIIQLRGCVYNDPSSKIIASAEGDGLVTPLHAVTPVKDCNATNNFYYAGAATTLTFTYTGVAFVSAVTINNEGTGESDLRSIFVGEKELALSDFTDGVYTMENIGFVEDVTAPDAFPTLVFAMKKGLGGPTSTGILDGSEQRYSYTFSYLGGDYQILIPYETTPGYTENAADNRYDITTPFGLKTVINLLNANTAKYKHVYLHDGDYYLGDVDGSYQHGFTLTATGVTLEGESRAARITGIYRGVTSSVVELKGNNTIVRNLTIESLLGDNGVGPALSTGADNLFFDNVAIIGWQDTYVGGGGKHLFHECTILGSVDFICNGDNSVDYFLRCDLQFQYRKNGGYITAPKGKSYFRDCTVSDVPTNAISLNYNYSLARPWSADTGHAFFINTTFAIVPNYGFVTMGGSDFKAGQYGTAGNLRQSDGALLTFNNASTTPYLELTDAQVQAYSSVYGICGSILAALAAEPIELASHHFASIYSADALQLPAGAIAYTICVIHPTYAELLEVGKAGDVIPANTPVLLQIDTATPIRFAYVADNGATPPAENLLSGRLFHTSIPDDGVNYYLLDSQANTPTIVRQAAGTLQTANQAYLTIANHTAERLDLKEGTNTSIHPEVEQDEEAVTTIYDLQGRKILVPEQGKIYVVNGKKRLYW